MTPQEFFDSTVAAVRKQGAPSLNVTGSQCRYRGLNGLKCAAGHHITDEEYSPAMEGRALPAMLHMLVEGHVLRQHADLAGALQLAHDHAHGDVRLYDLGGAFLDRFETRARRVAEHFGLVYTAPEA